MPTRDMYSELGQKNIFYCQTEEFVKENMLHILNTSVFNAVDYNPSRYLA